MTASTKSYAAKSCPNCGEPQDPSEALAALQIAQKTIADLQAQVRLLNQKAAAAVDRWADYEDELNRLRAAVKANNDDSIAATNDSNPDRLGTPTPSQEAGGPATSPRTSFLGATSSRISQLLTPRKSTPSLSSQHNRTNSNGHGNGPTADSLPIPPPRPSSPTTDDLLTALSREQSLRRAAEGKLDETSREVEELSVSLFEQANEMVASERKARARLEERVGVLERRDEEKRGRLERLEGAVGRIERVGRLLGEKG